MKLHLQNGGKAMPARQNLWRLSAGATQFHPGRYKPDGTTIDDVWTAVPAQDVTVAGKPLGSDGNLWVMLSDNQTVDVTPVAKGVSYYTFSVGQQKYPFYIGLQTSTTNANLDTDVPEVCVGQTVTLGVDWQDGNSPPAVAADIRWHLPAKYVNEQYAYSSTCTSYRQNADALTNSAIQCWYVNLPGGACSVREIGKWLEWDDAGNLKLEAEFKEPSDFMEQFKFNPPR